MRTFLINVLSCFSTALVAQVPLSDVIIFSTSNFDADRFIINTVSGDANLSNPQLSNLNNTLRIFHIDTSNVTPAFQTNFASTSFMSAIYSSKSDLILLGESFNSSLDTAFVDKYVFDYQLSLIDSQRWIVPLYNAERIGSTTTIPSLQMRNDTVIYIPNYVDNINHPYGQRYIYALDAFGIVSRHSWDIGAFNDLWHAKIFNDRLLTVKYGSAYFSRKLEFGTDQLEDTARLTKFYPYYDNILYSEKTPNFTEYSLEVNNGYAYTVGEIASRFKNNDFDIPETSAIAQLAIKFDSSFCVVDTVRLFDKYLIEPDIFGSIEYGRPLAIGAGGDIFTTMCVRNYDRREDSTSIYIARLNQNLHVVSEQLIHVDFYQVLYEIHPLSDGRIHLITQDQYPPLSSGVRQAQYFSYIVDHNGIISSTQIPISSLPTPRALAVPNPTQGIFRIAGLSDSVLSKISRVAISDVHGKFVYKLSLALTGTKEIDLSNLPSGTYLGQLLERDGVVVATVRIVKLPE